MPRCLSRLFGVISVSGALLIGADPAWKNKPISDWNEEDARQILANSPWTRNINAGIARRQTEDERREGGNMGQPHGVGADGIDDRRKTSLPAVLGGPTGGDTRPPSRSIRLQLRWESALPVRVAEMKAHVVEPPTLAGDGYSIAVYGIPGSDVKGDPRTLGNPLKAMAVLKREGKKDVKPSSVEVFEREDGAVVVYLFPPSAEITKSDLSVEFDAQIGRIVISQTFLLEEMQVQGKREL
jgi:hypothetical protein